MSITFITRKRPVGGQPIDRLNKPSAENRMNRSDIIELRGRAATEAMRMRAVA